MQVGLGIIKTSTANALDVSNSVKAEIEAINKRLPADKYIPVVVFEPNHLQLLHGGPEGRRSYLDDLLEQIGGAVLPLFPQPAFRTTLSRCAHSGLVSR